MCNRDQKSQFNSRHHWQLMIALSLALTTELAFAAVEGQPPAPKEPPVSGDATPPRFPDRITTLEGKTYERVSLVKVDPDGLLVSFVPAGGGSGSAKLKFRNLPAELRDRFGYDSVRASEYESAQASGEAAWLAQSAAWAEQRRAAQAEQAAWERQMRIETETRLAAEAERARVEAMQQEPAYYYYPGWWGWPGHGKSRGHGFHRHNPHLPQHLPAAGMMSSRVSSFMGPMRPLGR